VHRRTEPAVCVVLCYVAPNKRLGVCQRCGKGGWGGGEGVGEIMEYWN
jgi:hypothetical protein